MYLLGFTARMYSNQTVGFLLQKLEVTQEKVRVPTLEIIKHVVNSCGRYIHVHSRGGEMLFKYIFAHQMT